MATGLMLVAFLAAVVSFHLVEEPIRRKRRLPTSKMLLQFVGASSLVTACVALTGVFSNGLIQRYPTELHPFLAAPAERGVFRCGKVFTLLNPSAQTCPLSQIAETGAGAILILGDSHADVLKEMIVASGESVGRNVHLTTRNCDLGRFGSLPFCSRAVLQGVISEARTLGVAEIIAISYWEINKFDVASMTADIRALVGAGFTVRVMRPVPAHDSYDPRLRARNALAGEPLDLSGISRAAHDTTTAPIDRIIAQSVTEFPADQVAVLSPAEYLCSAYDCFYQRDGVPFYLDTNHLTFTGAREMKPMFDALLRP